MQQTIPNPIGDAICIPFTYFCAAQCLMSWIIFFVGVCIKSSVFGTERKSQFIASMVETLRTEEHAPTEVDRYAELTKEPRFHSILRHLVEYTPLQRDLCCELLLFHDFREWEQIKAERALQKRSEKWAKCSNRCSRMDKIARQMVQIPVPIVLVLANVAVWVVYNDWLKSEGGSNWHNYQGLTVLMMYFPGGLVTPFVRRLFLGDIWTPEAVSGEVCKCIYAQLLRGSCAWLMCVLACMWLF